MIRLAMFDFNRAWLRVALASVLAACTACVELKGPKNASRKSFERSVVTQVLPELAISFDHAKVEARDFEIDTVANFNGGSTLLRLWLPRDHWHPYTVAETGEGYLTLGGFAAPQLIDFAEVLGTGAMDHAALMQVARTLAQAADRYGAVSVLFPADSIRGSHLASPIREWQASLRSWWPSDTIITDADRSKLVRLTMLTLDSRSYARPWIPVSYAFRFDEAGALRGWAQRVGDAVYVPERNEAGTRR